MKPVMQKENVPDRENRGHQLYYAALEQYEKEHGHEAAVDFHNYIQEELKKLRAQKEEKGVQ